SARERAHQAAHERVHGLVAGPASQDGPGESQDAQLGDLEAARRRVEAAERGREAALHRRGQETQLAAAAAAAAQTMCVPRQIAQKRVVSAVLRTGICPLQALALHMKEHPDYKYRPRRKPKSVIKKENKFGFALASAAAGRRCLLHGPAHGASSSSAPSPSSSPSSAEPPVAGSASAPRGASSSAREPQSSLVQRRRHYGQQRWQQQRPSSSGRPQDTSILSALPVSALSDPAQDGRGWDGSERWQRQQQQTRRGSGLPGALRQPSGGGGQLLLGCPASSAATAAATDGLESQWLARIEYDAGLPTDELRLSESTSSTQQKTSEPCLPLRRPRARAPPEPTTTTTRCCTTSRRRDTNNRRRCFTTTSLRIAAATRAAPRPARPRPSSSRGSPRRRRPRESRHRQHRPSQQLRAASRPTSPCRAWRRARHAATSYEGRFRFSRISIIIIIIIGGTINSSSSSSRIVAGAAPTGINTAVERSFIKCKTADYAFFAQLHQANMVGEKLKLDLCKELHENQNFVLYLSNHSNRILASNAGVQDTCVSFDNWIYAYTNTDALVATAAASTATPLCSTVVSIRYRTPQCTQSYEYNLDRYHVILEKSISRGFDPACSLWICE
ncbi:unnamed protein product, partial [Trichogramma brassicae]